MIREELLRYGNELTICGFVVGNAHEKRIILLEEDDDIDDWDAYDPSTIDIHAVIKQLDVLEIEGLQKTILRKSQRQIDQQISWQVFRRDNFTCVYCGVDDVPMTVDHIVLWELMGDSVPNNLNCSCKKCNKTRGSMDYFDWLGSDYLLKVSIYPGLGQSLLTERGLQAEKLPLRKTKRSR